FCYSFVLSCCSGDLLPLPSFPTRRSSDLPWWEILTAALLIALAANTINLMDLRPGRAIKVFYLWFFILLAVFRSKTPLVLLSPLDRKSTRLNSSHVKISYAVFCLKKKNKE